MAAQALRELQRLVGEYVRGSTSLPLSQRVAILVGIQRALRDVAKRTVFPDIQAGRARILAYFQANVGKIVNSDELEVVSGIKDYPRRIRELRVQEGWPIVSGLQFAGSDDDEDLDLDLGLPQDLRPDQYILTEDKRDENAARRWQLANEIRRRSGGVKGKLLAYFRANVGENVTMEELKYVADNKGDWQRRTRELRTQDGWPVVTRLSGDPSMPPGMYKLAEDKQSEPHDRYISESVRREVMKRDGGRCQWRGCGWPEGFPESDHRFLEVHHIVHHVEGGENNPDNLVTLCNLHHDEVHRSDGVLDLEPGSPLSELSRLLERVSRLIGLESAREWIAMPNGHLEGHAPRELLGTAEGRVRLNSYITALEDGSFL